MTIQELMTAKPELGHAYESLEACAKKMCDADVGVIPILDEWDRLSGVITDRDICMAAYAQGRPLREIIVGEVMAKHPITCRPGDAAEVVAELMKEHRIRRVPVIDDEHHVIGIVSVTDLDRARVMH